MAPTRWWTLAKPASQIAVELLEELAWHITAGPQPSNPTTRRGTHRRVWRRGVAERGEQATFSGVPVAVFTHRVTEALKGDHRDRSAEGDAHCGGGRRARDGVGQARRARRQVSNAIGCCDGRHGSRNATTLPTRRLDSTAHVRVDAGEHVIVDRDRGVTSSAPARCRRRRRSRHGDSAAGRSVSRSGPVAHPVRVPPASTVVHADSPWSPAAHVR